MKLATHTKLAAMALTATLLATPVAADTVVITTKDGAISVSGQVVAISNRTMTIQTKVGDLEFDVNSVNCDGIGCPTGKLDNVLAPVEPRESYAS